MSEQNNEPVTVDFAEYYRYKIALDLACKKLADWRLLFLPMTGETHSWIMLKMGTYSTLVKSLIPSTSA